MVQIMNSLEFFVIDGNSVNNIHNLPSFALNILR